MENKIKQAAALDWAIQERARQCDLDQIYHSLLELWKVLTDEIKAAGRYDEYLQICFDHVFLK